MKLINPKSPADTPSNVESIAAIEANAIDEIGRALGATQHTPMQTAEATR